MLLCSFTKKKSGSVFPAFCYTTFHHALVMCCNVARAGVYDRIFFICLIESIQCFDKERKKIFSTAIFLPRVLTRQKREILLPVSYKTALAKTEDWE